MCHLVISAFWCSRGTYHKVQLAGGSISALWCRRAMEHSVQLQGVTSDLGISAFWCCRALFDDQGVGGTPNMGASAFCHMSN